MPFQGIGAQFLAERQRAGLFDEMGLGKTIQAVKAYDMAGLKSALVLAPHIALINWQREIEKWSGTKTTAILSNKYPTSKAPWQITNYEMLQSDGAVKQALKSQRFDALIVDESQMLKSHEAQRTLAVYGRHGIARQCHRLWCLSGTPAPNHTGELYSWILAACSAAIPVRPQDDFKGRAKRYMSYDEFLDQYTVAAFSPAGYPKITGNKNMGELRERLRPYSLRRLTSEVLPDMPPVRCSQLSFAPGEGLGFLDESEEMADLRIALLAALGKVMAKDPLAHHDDALLEAMLRLDTEYLATARRLFGEALAPMVAAQVEHEMREGLGKLVLFYHHRRVGDVLHDMLLNFGLVRVDGKTSQVRRQYCIDAFQQNPTIKIFLAQLDVAHRVITLTAAQHLIFAECAWTPGINWQAVKRCSRIGQKLPVLARFATLAGSLHEVIMRVMIRKSKMLAELWGETASFNIEGVDHAAIR